MLSILLKQYITYLLVCFSKEIIKHLIQVIEAGNKHHVFVITFKTSRKYWKLIAFTEVTVS